MNPFLRWSHYFFLTFQTIAIAVHGSVLLRWAWNEDVGEANIPRTMFWLFWACFFAFFSWWVLTNDPKAQR